jgi:hypothetical protein
MDNAQRLPVLVGASVSVVKRSRSLRTHVENEGVRELRDVLGHDVRQGIERVPIDAFGDEVEGSLDPLDAVDTSDPGVPQIRGEPDLLFEPSPRLLRVGRWLFWKADTLQDRIRAGSFNRSLAREQHGFAVIAPLQRRDKLVAGLSSREEDLSLLRRKLLRCAHVVFLRCARAAGNAARDKNGSYPVHEAEVNDMAGRTRSVAKDAARRLKT